MKTRLILTAMAAAWVCTGATGAELDYYRYLRYPKELVPEVGRNRIAQDGGPQAQGYRRRTVHWWPRQGQDIVEVPEGAPLRIWTRNKGQQDPEALAGVCRNWTASDPETFRAHLIELRGFGISTLDPRHDYVLVPEAVLRMENGRRRAVLAYPPFSMMVSQADHDFIHRVWETAFAKLQAAVSPEKYISAAIFNKPRPLVLETEHFRFQSEAEAEAEQDTLWWVRPHEPEKQELFRRASLEFAENMWTYIEAAGTSMPYWRREGPKHKYVVNVRLAVSGGWAGGGFGTCELRDNTGGPRNLGLSHEFYHGQPGGGWAAGYFGESLCHGGRHFNIPGETMMFSANFCHPWRNVNCTQYQSSLWFFALADNPNWGYGIISVAGCLASAVEPTPYHTIARLGQQRGLWKNGIKGFGDFFGEYAARMVTCDFVEQYPLRSKYGMPELSHVYPVYRHENRYRISNAEAPRMYGFNIVRLKPGEGASEIGVDFHGFYEPENHSDWRVCIVAVDAKGRARYSPLWNQGRMRFALKASDKHLWLTVAATPAALPIVEPLNGRGQFHNCLIGIHAPRYPWEMTLTGCEPGSPHRRQGDVVNLDELYALNNGGKYIDYSVKSEVPIPLSEEDGPLAQDKLADMLARVAAAERVVREKIASDQYDDQYWWEQGKLRALEDLARRIEFLQRNAQGHRHANGRGFVADSAHVAPTAYVGPHAMVLDGARVEGHARIKDYAVVHGPKTVVRAHASIGGKAWVFGDIVVAGDARILESAVVTTIGRVRETYPEGRATIAGSAVIKGEHILRLCEAKDQVLTGGLLMDYTPGTSGVVGYGDLVPGIANLEGGTFDCGRIYGRQRLGDGAGAGALYANWQFNQPKAAVLEDSYVHNNGILHGRPQFGHDGRHRYIEFNGRDQYAEAPPSVADFGELTVDMLIHWAGTQSGRLFDFGTGEEECFYLAVGKRSGRLTLTARHAGKTHRVATSEGLSAGKWVRVRLEMDGQRAAICLDGKRAAEEPFAFRPRMVFIGDRAEGNFIACARNQDEFFQGRMDHFRIYRKVHEEFDALGPVPFALTQLQEWSEEDQQRADRWEAQRRAKEAELLAGEYGRLKERIKRLEEQKSTLRRTGELEKLEARLREAEESKRTLDRQMNEQFRALLAVGRLQEEIDRLRRQLEAIRQEIRQSSDSVKLSEQIQSCQQQRNDLERQIRESPQLAALDAAVQAADEQRRAAEERIRGLPELAELKETIEQETDGQKKRELQEQYNRLFEARRLADADWQQAELASRRLREQYNQLLRARIEGDPQRTKLDRELERLRDELSTLETNQQEAHPEYGRLQQSLRAKEQELQEQRRRFEQQFRAKDTYQEAESACAAARQAVEHEKQRLEQETSQEVAKLDAQIADLRTRAETLRAEALRAARFFGPNPHPGREAARLKDFQESLIYHTTADWDDRTREEAAGTVPDEMKAWLLRVRGY